MTFSSKDIMFRSVTTGAAGWVLWSDGSVSREPIDLSVPHPEPEFVIPAVRDGKQLVFYCSLCRTRHYHGAHGDCTGCGCELHADYQRRGPCTCPVGAGNGHRVAHCTSPRSPYLATGYILREVTR